MYDCYEGADNLRESKVYDGTTADYEPRTDIDGYSLDDVFVEANGIDITSSVGGYVSIPSYDYAGQTIDNKYNYKSSDCKITVVDEYYTQHIGFDGVSNTDVLHHSDTRTIGSVSAGTSYSYSPLYDSSNIGFDKWYLTDTSGNETGTAGSDITVTFKYRKVLYPTTVAVYNCKLAPNGDKSQSNSSRQKSEKLDSQGNFEKDSIVASDSAELRGWKPVAGEAYRVENDGSKTKIGDAVQKHDGSYSITNTREHTVGDKGIMVYFYYEYVGVSGNGTDAPVGWDTDGV